MRVLLFTGKGGAGKTTAAAGTATLGALRGQRTLVLSTDAAHSLGDAFDLPVGPEPTRVDTNLFAQQVDAQQRFERSWAEIQSYLLSVLQTTGIDPIAAEELTVLPGAEEVLALLEVRDQARSGGWDLVVVDCAPTADTLRLLALPEALGWYMDRVLPLERAVVTVPNPVPTRAAAVPMPKDSVFDAVQRLHRDLTEVRRLLTGGEASVRLVLTPEAVVVAEARRSLTTLSLYGYRVDGVIANRIFPAADADAWRRQWVVAQSHILADVETSFAPLAVWRSPYRSCEPVGLSELAAFAAQLYGTDDPFRLPGDDPVDVRRVEGRLELSVALPFAEVGDVDVVRRGDGLVMTVGCHRRLLALPAALQQATVRGAALRAGVLVVTFEEPGGQSQAQRGKEQQRARAPTGTGRATMSSAEDRPHRRSDLVTLTIGVDVGGTKIAAGVVNPDGTVVETSRRVTPARESRATEDAIIALVGQLRQQHEIEAVGIAAAGYIDAQRATVLFAANLAWRNEPLKDTIESAVELPTVVENDANAAAWGEFRFGAGADVDELLMVALGTGMGGGIVLKGELFRGTFGIAGEFGHIRAVPGGRLCGCGNHGCWEQYASGKALVHEVREMAEKSSTRASAVLDAADGDLDAITGPMITAGAKEGDRLCIAAFQTVGAWLGQGLADLASSFDPGVVVIGGGVSEAGDLLLDPTREAFRRQLSGRGHRPEMEIRLAGLGNAAGMTGAADLARRR